MSNKVQKRFQITVKMNVTIDVIAECEEDGEGPEIISVNRVDLPYPRDVMEALDNEDELGQLDEAFENGEKLP